MFISVACALAMIFGSQIYGIQESLESSYSSTEAFQIVVFSFSCIALVILLLGKSLDNPAGVRYSVLVAMVFSIGGLLVFLRYDRAEL